jgi:putative transposase
LPTTEGAQARELLNCERFVDMAPAAVWAMLLDEGRYLCSESTMYRILRTAKSAGSAAARPPTRPRSSPS